MQPADLTKFNNPNNWHVVHDPADNMFYIKSAKGHTLHGSFTTRRFAENRLYTYLENATRKAEELNAKKNKKA